MWRIADRIRKWATLAGRRYDKRRADVGMTRRIRLKYNRKVHVSCSPIRMVASLRYFMLKTSSLFLACNHARASWDLKFSRPQIFYAFLFCRFQLVTMPDTSRGKASSFKVNTEGAIFFSRITSRITCCSPDFMPLACGIGDLMQSGSSALLGAIMAP